MKLEKKQKSMIFSETDIPDVFFTEHLPQMPGECVKIYLYLLFLSKDHDDVKEADLSKMLAIPYPTVESGIKYLEDNGLLLRKPDGYAIVDLQEQTLHNAYKPNITISPEKIEANAKNSLRSKAINHINNTYFQGTMSPTWYSDIDLWFNKYNFDEEVMIALFDECYRRSALHRKYAQAVAEAWNARNIRTWNDLEAYEQEREKLVTIEKAIAKKLGKRSLTEYEKEYIKTWVNEYQYGMEVIEIALKRTTLKANPNFEYLNNIITDWYNRNLRTPDKIKEFLEKRSKERKTTKKQTTQNTKNKYEQRQYSNLNFLYANKDVDKKGDSNG